MTRSPWRFTFSLLLFCLAILFATFRATAAETLSLEQYEKQVRGMDPQFKAAQLTAEGARAAEPGAEQMTDMSVIAEAYFNDDRRPTNNPGFQGDRTETEGAYIGLQKQFLWGPTFQITQNFTHVQIYNASPSGVPLPEYYDSYPKVSLSIPLWRNFFGAQTRAQQESLKTQSRSEVVRSDVQMVDASSRIEMAFYTLAANRENVQLQKDILDRANRIQKWVSSQHKRGLVDISDLHQARAAVAQRKLQLQEAELALRKSAREFNQLRGRQSDVVEDDLRVAPLQVEQLKLSKAKVKMRKDLVLNRLAAQSQALTYRDRLESMKPQLDLAVQGQWNGRDPEYSEAQSESFKEDQTLWYVGLQFTMPLDVPKYMDVRDGLRKMSKAGDLSLQAQERDIRKAWVDFVDEGETLYSQLQLARDLEDVQRKKADAERVRFTRGRSTTYQVLSFEQDYIEAKNQRINLELKARQYLTQTDLFQEKL